MEFILFRGKGLVTMISWLTRGDETVLDFCAAGSEIGFAMVPFEPVG